MPTETLNARDVRYPSVPYVLPFVVFIALLAMQHYFPLPGHADLTVRTIVLTGVLVLASRNILDFRASRPYSSILLGIFVFLIWIGPDLLSPGYRHHWMFQNSLLGTTSQSLSAELRHDPLALALRSFRAVILVPIIEELFWRGWMMRSLIHPRFDSVPLGAFTTASFWITAVLFASEHGPYWDVGLVAGVLYNLWMVRTRNLADCMLAHAVTNLCLSIYVMATSQWQYWQ